MDDFKYKPAGLLDTIGLNRYFVTDSALKFTKGYMSTKLNVVQGLWDQDPNTFEKAGHESAETAADALGVGVAAKFGWDMRRRVGATQAWKKGTTVMGETLTHGVIRDPSTGATLGGAAAAEFKAGRGIGARISGMRETGVRSLFNNDGLKHGFLKPGKGGSFKFIKSPNLAVEFGMMLGLPILTGMVGGAVLGAAGSYLDMAHADYRNRKGMWYDSRFFDTRQADASTYQQMGMAMNQYQSNMVSMARIFHAR